MAHPCRYFTLLRPAPWRLADGKNAEFHARAGIGLLRTWPNRTSFPIQSERCSPLRRTEVRQAKARTESCGALEPAQVRKALWLNVRLAARSEVRTPFLVIADPTPGDVDNGRPALHPDEGGGSLSAICSRARATPRCRQMRCSSHFWMSACQMVSA
jgi:hypothetical protein